MKIKKIYFVGIKGVGMTSLAIIAKEAGLAVGGSDVKDEFITDKALLKAKIKCRQGFLLNNFINFVKKSNKADVLLITTGAHGGFANPEVKYAQDNGFKILTYGQAVGLFMDQEILTGKKQRGVAVAASHGKTTITAMLATCLAGLGFDPSYLVGTSQIFPLGLPGHYGQGDLFIAEADEYLSEANFGRQSKFLYQHPEFTIINNIDFDHPDFFKDLNAVKNVFALFVKNVKKGGLIIFNGDDQNLAEIVVKNTDKKILSFGTGKNNDFHIENYQDKGFFSAFQVFNKNILLGDFNLSIPGYHNAKNSLSVIAFLSEMGVEIKKIQAVLPLYKGAKRRMEKIGRTKNDALIIDDYAHHPKEIKTTLRAIKMALPGKKIVCIFQPHTFSRTQALYEDFLSSFQDASFLILLPTFKSAREEIADLTDINLKADFTKIRNNFISLADFKSVVEYVNSDFRDDSFIIVTMGAGDVYKIAQDLKKS